MSDRIRIGTSTTSANNLRSAIASLRAARDRIEYCKEIMDECIDGVDYSDLETEFGLSAGDGEAVYNLTAGAKANVDDSASQQFISRIG